MGLLFTPIAIGPLLLPNRIVMPAMHLNYTPDGHINEAFLAFYRERAKGGVGLIQIGGCPIEAEAGSAFMVGVNRDDYLPGLRRFTEAIHAEGAKVGLQLYHAGRYTYSFFLNGQAAPSASATFSPLTKEMAREMSEADIAATLDDYGEATRRAREAGFDAVEVIASAGYLINQFLSPLTNQRRDAYGGSFENRARFGVEVLRRVVKEAGPEIPVTVRLSGHDFVPGSNTSAENAAFAALLEEAGAAMFNVTGGWHESSVPQITNSLPPGGYAYLARNVKRRVKVPVAASNRILDPEQAERLLREGSADLVSLGRALIADPDWPRKAQAGRASEIRRCVSCNQECLDRVFELKPVGCLVNPRAGHEHEEEAPLCAKRRVVIAGGGPAGLAAAESAARRGHEVTLYEARAEVGGQIWAASRAPGKDEFASLPGTLATQAELAGARIETEHTVTREELLASGADLIVIATGARGTTPPIPGIDAPQVVQALDVLEGGLPTPVPARVVVIGGGPIGVETALYLARIGTIAPETAAFLLEHEAENPATVRELLLKGTIAVTVVEMTTRIGQGIGRSTRWVHLLELKKRGVTLLTERRAQKLEGDTLALTGPAGEERLSADLFVLATGLKSHDPFADLEKETKARVLRVGDAAFVKDAAAAIRETAQLLKDI